MESGVRQGWLRKVARRESRVPRVALSCSFGAELKTKNIILNRISILDALQQAPFTAGAGANPELRAAMAGAGDGRCGR